jgi:MFS family permease
VSGDPVPRRAAQVRVVYAAGLVQGIALVTFPAASSIFGDHHRYGLSNAAYGAMFLPQAIMAITFSLLGASLSRRVPVRSLYLAGLVANLVSMALLATSSLYARGGAAYPTLLVATASLGLAFGLTVPAINTLTAELHPDRVDGSVLVLNALLGLGTTLAPVFVAIFVGLGFWWGLPVMSAVLLVGLLLASLPLPLAAPAVGGGTSEGERPHLPTRFWLFAAFALLYGVCETMNGNWSQLDMTKHLGASAVAASIALTAFWGMVTVGRVAFAALQRRIPSRDVYRVLPFFLAVVFLVIAALPRDSPALGIVAFAAAGLGCSALLPLTITFGQEQLVAISAAMAGGVIAFYQVGYGIAAFGAGPLQSAGVTLSALFGVTAIVAFAMGLLSLPVAHRAGQPATLHPRPVRALPGAK